MNRLRAIAGVALGAFLAFAVQAKAEVKSYSDYSGGLNTRISSALLNDNESPNLKNVVLDKNSGVSRREGITKINSTAIGGGISDVQAVYQLETSGGTKYCVSFSSVSGYSSTDGCATNTVFVSTLTRNNDVNCDAYGDKLYCVNNQYNFSFDGTNDVSFSATPSDLNYIRVFRNRCFAAGKDANPSRLYWSALGNCDSWTVATDYVDLDAEDGDTITGIGPPQADLLPVYKNRSTFLIQFDNANPSNRRVITVSKTTGAKNHRAVAGFNNRQYFASTGPSGGQPGIYSTDGLKIQEESGKLRGEIDGLSNFFSNTGRKTIDTKAEFDAGTFDTLAMSSSRDAGFMQSSYTSRTDTLGADFGAYTLTNLSTVAVSGSLTMHQASSGTFINAGAESGDGVINWEQFEASYSANANTTMYGSYNYVRAAQACGSSGYFELRALNETNGLLIQNHYDLYQNMGVLEYTLDTSSITNGRIKLEVEFSNSNGTSRSKPFITPDNIKFKVSNILTNVVLTLCTTRWDVDEASMTVISSATTPIYDMAISTPIWGLFTVNQTSGAVSSSTGAITYQIRVSTANDGGGFDSYITPTIGAQITNAAKRYAQLTMRYEVASTTVIPPQIHSLFFEAASTGTWQSAETFLSNTMTATWGLFQCDQTVTGTGASIAYCVKTSTFSGGTTSASCVSSTCGSAITASTGAYVVVFATYTLVSATQTAKTDNITINWNEGTSARSPTMSVYKGRLHFCAQSSSGTFNDTCYVLDDRGAWTRWAGVNARFLNIVGQSFVVGGSTETSGGFIYKLYDGNSDDGSAIESFWESKDYTLGELQNRKAIDRIYLLGSNDATTLTTTLKADTGLRSTDYSMNLSTGMSFKIINQTVTPTLNGNTFRLRFGNNAASKPWSVFGHGFLYRDLGIAPP